MIKNIRHTGIVVRDLEMSKRFYCEVFGFAIVKQVEESGNFIDNISALQGVRITTVKMATPDGQMIELLYCHSHSCEKEPREIFDMGITHIAFTVENLDLEYERLKKTGVKFNSTPWISPDGRAKVVFCRDPEGNLIELVEELA